jgi:hypothetical protein
MQQDVLFLLHQHICYGKATTRRSSGKLYIAITINKTVRASALSQQLTNGGQEYKLFQHVSSSPSWNILNAGVKEKHLCIMFSCLFDIVAFPAAKTQFCNTQTFFHALHVFFV